VTAPAATGRIATVDGAVWVVLERRFDAHIDDVWASVTESERLETWIGRWEGDPASGAITVYMTAEAEDAAPERYDIRECEPPRHFAAETTMGDERWHVALDLVEAEGLTTLRLRQRLGASENAGDIGPGWEYYLDRLVAAREGRDVAAIDWDEYYPALSSAYVR
jgi:uncharacterized protein YndB with AHSA1/START domain